MRKMVDYSSSESMRYMQGAYADRMDFRNRTRKHATAQARVKARMASGVAAGEGCGSTGAAHGGLAQRVKTQSLGVKR